MLTKIIAFTSSSATCTRHGHGGIFNTINALCVEVPWSDVFLILHTRTSHEVAGWTNLWLPWTKI